VVLLLGSFFTGNSQCIKGNCQNGNGVYIFSSGAKYHGSFSQGTLHGHGKCFFTNGDIYVGQWYKNVRQGKGVFKSNNGIEYQGEFRHNKMHGKGILVFNDGSSFSSVFELGHPVGEGIFKDTDGRENVGQLQEGQFVGTEKMAENSKVEIQSLRDCNKVDCRDGTGTYTFADGSYYEGDFQNGRPFGIGTCYYSNGDKYMGDWKLNAPDGTGTMWYKNKSSMKGFWVNGKIKRTSQTQINFPEKKNGKRVDIYAVIVGVARYTEFEALKYTDDDAYRMYAFLKSPEGGAVPDENIRILIDESAIAKNIEKSIDEVVTLADENDVIITYFAGHGLNGSFIPYDCNGYQNQLKYENVKSKLALARAKQKLCIVDACYSGSLLAMKSPMMESLNLFYNQLSDSNGGTAFLMSSKEEEFSLESRGLRQGIFSHFLIEGLKGKADKNANKIITINELYNFVQREVSSYSGDAQNPILAGQFDKNMPVGLIR
jgi:hypothetical protein